MKVKKSAKKQTPPPKDVVTYVERILKASDQELVPTLRLLDFWRFPRGDLHAWTAVLDRFDSILADIIESYELSKLQTNEFTPKTKELVLEILRVQKLLLENCTNRKLFASYDRLYDLFLTIDLAVLHAALQVLLRPAQQYLHSTPFEPGLGGKVIQRLLILSRGWETLHAHGSTLAVLASAREYTPADEPVTVTFYPTSSVGSSKTGEAAVTVDLKGIDSGNPHDQLAQLAEENGMPLEDQFAALNRLRLSHMRDLVTRRKLLEIRLTALAAYVCLSPEDAAQSNLFLYEPDLIAQIAELLSSAHDVGDCVLTAAVLSLDGCARHRSKLSEVTASLSASVGHGLLMTLFRFVVRTEHSYELVDALLQFLGMLVGSPTHGNMLMSAGVLPLILELTGHQGPRRDNYIPRACGLIDTIMFAVTQGMSMLSNADGLNILVNRIKDEINMDWHPSHSEIVSEDSALAYAASPLKAFLRSVHRLMTATGGTEGLRNLVDTDLPKSLKWVFENPTRFGDRVLSLCINIMATFVHNEPTSLSILQELQLPQTLYTKLEDAMPRSYDVIVAVPGAIGAVCLNPAGLKYTSEHPKVMTNLIDVALSSEVKDTPIDRDHAATVGAALDELVRHHPPLRPIVQDKVFALLREATEAGSAFEPPEDQLKDYAIDAMTAELAPKEAPTNEPLNRFAKIFRLLEGVLRNGIICKDFVREGGIEILLGVADLPCVPIKFGGTEAATHLSHVLRSITEHDHIILVGRMINSIEQAMERCTHFWQGDDVHDVWMKMHRGETETIDRDQFKQLRGLAIRLTYLSDSFLGVSFSHSRIATSLIKALRANQTFLPNLATLHRVAFREHATLQTTLPSSASPTSVVEGEIDPSKESGAKFLATRMNAILAKFWKSSIKLLFVKRTPEAAHRTEASGLADGLAEMLVSFLQPAEAIKGVQIDTVAVGLAAVLLFDERAHEGYLNTLLFLAFEKKGGIDALNAAMARLVDIMDEQYAGGKKDDVPAIAGIKVAVMILGALVSPKALLESPQTHALVGREKFSPPDVLVKLRRDLFPLIRRIWESDWLPMAPTPLVKPTVKAFLTLMDSKAEEASAVAPQAFVPPVPAIARMPATADPARVEQLVEMGFERSAAELALIRARNNVAAAADLILSMPHMFQNLREPQPAPAAAEDPPATGNEGEGEGRAQAEAAPAADGFEAAEPAAGPAAEPESMEVDTPDLRAELNRRREEVKGGLASRALLILDHNEDLVFDLLPAFPTGPQGLSFLLDRTIEVAKEYDSSREVSIASRLRLVVVFLKSNDIGLDEEAASKAQSLLSSIPLDMCPRPRWLPAALLFGEIALINASFVLEVKLGEDTQAPVAKQITPLIRTKLCDACLAIAADKDCSRDELLSALRLLVVISRNSREPFKNLPDLLDQFAKPDPKLRGCQPLLAMIIRHAFEDHDNLLVVMRREIQQWMTPARNKVSDINHFVRQLRQVALRSPTDFVEAVDSTCALVDPAPPQSVFHIRSKDTRKEADGSDPFRETPVPEPAREVMDMLLSQLFKAVGIAKAGSEEEGAVENAHAYSGMVISLLTEIIGSYIPAKQVFLSALRTSTTSAPKSRGITAIINDWICDISLVEISGAPALRLADANRRLALSSWAASMIVGLCSDITPTADIKDLPEDLVSVRKTVLDAITRAIKDSGVVADLNARYGRLCALSELAYRLLLARPSVAPRQSDESGTHIAKIMIEKNFVSILTVAAGEVDLNYPNVRQVLGSILRALEHLSKMSIKWGKAERPKDEAAMDVSASEDESEDESEMDMDEEEEAPDLYRNSALGMGMPRDDDDEDEDEEDEDEEDMMQFGGDDVMDEIMDDDEDTQPSTEDEDEMEDGMVHEDDWTDEEEGEEVEGDDLVEQEVILGTPGEDEVVWDREVELDHESVLTDDEGGGHDEDPYGEAFFEGEEDDDEMDIDDEQDYDEIDILEPIPTAEQAVFYGAPPENTGSWGWEQGSVTRPAGTASTRSRLLGEPRNADVADDAEDEASALFGGSRRNASSNPAQHPLITPPSAGAQPFRRLPRGLGTMNGLQELLQRLEGGASQEAMHLLQQMVEQTRTTGAEAFRVDLTQDVEGAIVLTLGGRSFHLPAPSTRTSATEDVTTDFVPKPTLQRWLEEMSIVPAGYSNTYTTRLVMHIVNRLMPEAKKRADEDAEKQKKADEEEEALLTKMEEEKKAQAKREREEELLSAAAVALPESRVTPEPPTDTDVEMAPLENAEAEEAAPGEETSTLARTIITIHGREVDITDTGIDLEFLQALPDDMRADVVEQYMREQNRHRRPAATDVPEPSSQISREFLEALPPDIRAEVLMQEAIESARRARPEQIVAEPAQGALLAPDALVDLAEELQTMGTGMAAIANLLSNPVSRVDFRTEEGRFPAITLGRPGPSTSNAPKRPHREAVQLLDKNGIACLVRLLFFPEVFKRGYLFRVLVNLCENTNTRSDLLNLLLSVVQDGSGDLPAVDRSFQQMSLRAMTTPKITPKAKIAESPAPSQMAAAPLFAHLQSDHIPTFIAQRCFEALSYIVSSNQHAVTFFLTEHEQAVGLRKPMSKKGKGKEKVLPQTKFPIVILLGLLDRPVLLKTASMMESLTSLMATITKPLAALKQSKDRAEVKPKETATEGETSAIPITTATPAPPTATVETPGVPATTSPRPPTTLTKPPVIPSSVIRLVVNCMTIGECTSRTFSQTLGIMQNLSCIPDAKEIILQELRSRSQELGSTIQQELGELATALREGDDVDAATLAKFSPQSSSQAQLLRLLKTIDYLHISKVDSEPGETLSDEEKAVGLIFETFDLDPMWRQLGECLSIVESRGTTDQIATILLPLVEALMVVCKYRSRVGHGRESSLPPVTPLTELPPSGDLFVSFTTAHRKVLNAIVRNNPALLSGSFSLLVRNPRVLEFDNKRNWFFQKLKRKKDQLIPSGVLNLNIRRQYVFEDSFHALQRKTGDEIKYGKLSVKFYNEDGIDAGGVTREWYSVLAQQIFDPNFALFEPCAADKQTYQPNKASAINVDHLAYFKFVGRVIGKAVFDGRLLDAYFNRAFYKQILGRTVDMRDLESIDPEYHKSLQWMLDNDITGVIDQEFTIEDDQFGEKKIVELKEGGAKIPVTENNKQEYVRLVVSYRLDNSIKDQIKAFLEGFYDIIPRSLIQIFEPDQLELLISGITTIDVDELKNATQLSGWKSTDPEISWFWRALRSFSQEERARFLMFVTSSSRVPLGGFTQLQGASGTQPFQIQKLYAKEGSLPQASTCFNLLLLPKFEAYEQLRDKLMFAVYETGGFGKA